MPNEETKKRPPSTFLIVKTEHEEHHLSAADLALLLRVHEPVTGLVLGLERGQMTMSAAVEPKEADYPGITVDAYTPQAGDIYLGNFELPCETYPTRIAARLYAGCHLYETDEPIAAVTHEITDDARVLYRAGKHRDPRERMHKLVYVDHDLADSRSWTQAGEDCMPEHREDE